jgi:hypothetical protein
LEVASGAAMVVAAAAPMALCNSILLMKPPDDPTIISIVGVALVEDAVTTSSALVTLRAVSAAVLPFGLRHEDNNLLALGVIRLGLRQRRLIRLKCIYNFLCSMLVYAPFALFFVTLHGVFMHFPELTY